MNPEDKDAATGLLLAARNRANEAMSLDTRELVDGALS